MFVKSYLFIKEYFLVIIFLIISVYFFNDYLNISAENELPESDELGYLDEGIHLRDVSYDFKKIINRNRTPLLPLVVSFLAQDKGTLIQFSEEYIDLFRETQLAIISIVFFISFLLFLKLKNKFKSNFLIIFFFIYFFNVPIKAQIELVFVEPIFMTLYLIFIITAINSIDSNSIKDYLILGLLGGLLFLAKYTGFLIFIFTLFSLFIYKVLFLKNKNFKRIFKNLLLSFVTFISVGLPYLIANVSDGLNPFYSVNSKIIWYSSWPEAYENIKKYNGNFGFKDMPEDLYPSFSYFLNNNGGFDGLIDRLNRGLFILRGDFIDVNKLAGQTLIYCIFLLTLIIFILFLASKNNVWNDFKKNRLEIIFLVSLTTLLLFGFLLYSDIANGDRLYLYTTIPIMYYLFYLVDFFLSYVDFEGKKKLVFNTFLISCFVYMNLIIYDVFWFLLHPLGFLKSLFV